MGGLEGVLWKINNIFNGLHELKDDRTKHEWPSFTVLSSILLAYLYFVKKAGPEWMKGKKPYELKNTMMVYNFVQIIICFYTFCAGSWIYFTRCNIICQPVEYSDEPILKEVHNLVFVYMLLKISDLLDTVFFVLRKKDRQISTLHVYHHTLMPFASWLAYKYFPNGHMAVLGIINCFVHSVMYTYYLIAGLGPEYQKYLWWKKHVTTLQLVQFVTVFFHNAYPLLSGGCGYPAWIHFALCVVTFQFSYMFGNFYYVTYIKNKPGQKTSKKNPNTQTKLHSK